MIAGLIRLGQTRDFLFPLRNLVAKLGGSKVKPGFDFGVGLGAAYYG